MFNKQQNLIVLGAVLMVGGVGLLVARKR